MGCDIHIITEIRQNGSWVRVEEIPEVLENRNYSTFAFLAGVRNRFNTKGFEAKGEPDDMSEDTKGTIESWKDDAHSHSYLSLQELVNKDKTDYISIKCKVVKDFVDEIIKKGGSIPEGIEIEEFTPECLQDVFAHSFEPLVIAKWQADEEKTKDYPIFKGIAELKEIAQKYAIENYEDIRIVFFFDN